jgi:hypothetical protein
MPKYDATKVQEALLLVKERVPYNEIAERTGMGRSTLDRHVQEYRNGNRPDVDVGELPAAKSGPSKGGASARPKPTRAGTALASALRVGRTAADFASEMLREAASKEEEAGRLAEAVEELKEDAIKLRATAAMLRGEAPSDASEG